MEELDPTVIRAAASGDQAAFAVIVRLYQQPVWRFLRGLLGDAHLAEDVAQETFLRVYRNLVRFRFGSKFSTWVFAIARNAGIDALRKRQRNLRLVERSKEVPVPATAAPAASAELRAALAALSTDHREAFLVIEVLGMSYQDAGLALGIKEGTV